MLWSYCCPSTSSLNVSWVLVKLVPKHRWPLCSIILHIEPKSCLNRQRYLPLMTRKGQLAEIVLFQYQESWDEMRNWIFIRIQPEMFKGGSNPWWHIRSSVSLHVYICLSQFVTDVKRSRASLLQYGVHEIDVYPYMVWQ